MKWFLFIHIFYTTSSIAQQRKLVWQEEFNYVGLPNSKKWKYEEGFVRNRETQYYTVQNKKNVWVEHGYLTISGIKETTKNKQYKQGSTSWKTKDSLASYTSASITTLGKVSFKYGRIEIRAKLPNAKGMWPAIWMMGSINRKQINWPKCGEIDIMEFVGSDTSHIHAAVHYEQNNEAGFASSINKTLLSNTSTDFNVYALEWTKDKLEFYVNNILYHSFSVETATYKKSNPFRKPFYLIINLAMGASWPGPIDDRALPQKFLIDYIRVYQ